MHLNTSTNHDRTDAHAQHEHPTAGHAPAEGTALRILYSHRIQSRDGQGVHIDALVHALRTAGHEVRIVGPPAYENVELGGESRMVARLLRWLPGFLREIAEIAYAVPAFLRLRRAAREFQPDIIYERANLFHFAGTWTAQRMRLPLLLEVNSPLAEERARFAGLRLKRLAHAAERYVWRRANAVLPVTSVLAGHVAAAGVAAERIVVVQNGIALEEFPPRKDQQATNGILLGFVGFVRDWHGLDGIIRGLAEWRGAQRLELMVVGDGPARAGLESLAADLGIADRVRFTGLASRSEVPGLIAQFDIALQPAAVAYASPLKVFEYMAAGCAIIAPDQPNLREILEHDKTAVLFDPADRTALWRGVERLAGDPKLRARIGAAAREEVVLRDFTWAGNARRVMKLAHEILTQQRPVA